MSQTPNSPAIGDRRLHGQPNTSVHGTVLFPARRRLPVNRGSWRLNASIVYTPGSGGAGVGSAHLVKVSTRQSWSSSAASNVRHPCERIHLAWHLRM